MARRAKVIAVLNQKGGVGKTTICTNLARAAQLDGHEVLIADSDRQASCLRWMDVGEDFDLPVIGAHVRKMSPALRPHRPNYDLIIIDGEPSMHARTETSIDAADLVLLPVQPSVVDMWSVSNILDILDEGGEPDDKAAFVLTRVDTRVRDVSDAVDYLSNIRFPLLETQIVNRIAYSRALGQGSSVLDMEPSGKAAEEVRSLYSEIKTILFNG